ncbi:hypothetical protein FT663_01090 [Candidozyma haemuli var. vulneris]|uniref:Large ribosomal subunit protein mL40 n=1 Tax=Candidozyma haemuli TaxID=45357 RepID=A0A2V1ATP9_9ASCO|nr:hypothetical protein CXQ85_000440 [[Candida] haemuloni]KAF3985300.1 hypothetical protein FT662_05226 [[Candida] haemuloni var. vulneris]KAF3994860.1 hypothetical protein FT663_01090 [[Candida] haemuloni var. vulneris]PVH21460.1 hypothetical protein CXQ85_000440 [[Candida] haemuloni]
MFSSNARVASRTFVRSKVTTVSPDTQKVVNQLSVLSASKKQPKVLKLCQEDLVKHQTITNAWRLFKRKNNEKRHQQLAKQYESIKTAMSELKEVSPELFEIANKKEPVRFPVDFRIPTDYPPNKPWVTYYSKPETEK